MSAQIQQFTAAIPNGDPTKCEGLLLLCSLNFVAQEDLSDESKVAHVLSPLTDKVLTWATTVSLSFTELIHPIFNHASEGKQISKRLMAVKQRNQMAAKYALEFHMLVAESGWKALALKATF